MGKDGTGFAELIALGAGGLRFMTHRCFLSKTAPRMSLLVEAFNTRQGLVALATG